MSARLGDPNTGSKRNRAVSGRTAVRSPRPAAGGRPTYLQRATCKGGGRPVLGPTGTGRSETFEAVRKPGLVSKGTVECRFPQPRDRSSATARVHRESTAHASPLPSPAIPT